MSRTRILQVEQFPTSLWDGAAGCICLPPDLADAYESLIDKYSLRDLAAARDPNNPPVGGLDQKKTDQHFAQAFDGSVARTQLALIDPHDVIPHVSDAFLTALAGNATVLADCPSGAGAAGLGFLTSIAELRRAEVLPREPLDVQLISAEISEPARTYANELLELVRPSLESQAIFVKATNQHWDVTDTISNTDLIQTIVRASSGNVKCLLVIANFNGFLEKERKRTESQPQLEELFRHVSGDQSAAIWIEPAMNTVTQSGGLFGWLRKQVSGPWLRFTRELSAREITEGEPVATCASRFKLPLDAQNCANVRLAVMAIKLCRNR